jgi:thiol-disulfide isomerase/thioredoxin
MISSCQEKANTRQPNVEVFNQFSDLNKIIEAHSDKVLVLNFWATTCPPCIKEMPHFNALRDQFPEEDLEVWLVSLDNVKRLEDKVFTFVSKHQLKPNVGLLADENYSYWTEKIDSSWMGALPATLIKYGDNTSFKFGAYETYGELLDDIKNIKPNEALKTITSDSKFDSVKWKVKKGGEYPYRDQMLEDLVTNDSIRSLSQKELIALLGPPKKIDNNHLFYLISEKKAIITLHTKTLVIKYKDEKELEWMKIHQ